VRAKEGKWLGLKAHYGGLSLQGGLEMHLGRGGYVGLTAIEKGRVNVCALLPAGGGGEKATLLPRRLREIGLHGVAERLESAEVDVGSITGVSHFDLGFQHSDQDDGVIALGDGHSMIPPFTGAGMSMAFEASARALPHLVAWAEGAREWNETAVVVRRVLRQHFVARMRWAALVHRALLSPAGPWLLKAGVGWKWLPFNSLVRALRGA
jgi:2-polyprenyl-6-methoxyphenol hydroxylase-like FAD-dependent oxidoreductase